MSRPKAVSNVLARLVKGNTSRRTERVGKTPKQLLTGQAHPHWLELLGFQRLASA